MRHILIRKHRLIQGNYNEVNRRVLYRRNRETMGYHGEQQRVLVDFRELISMIISNCYPADLLFQRIPTEITDTSFSFIGRIDLWCWWFSTTTIQGKSHGKIMIITGRSEWSLWGLQSRIQRLENKLREERQGKKQLEEQLQQVGKDSGGWRRYWSKIWLIRFLRKMIWHNDNKINSVQL